MGITRITVPTNTSPAEGLKTIASIMALACRAFSPDREDTVTVPSSLMSTLAPVCSVMALIFLPPGPITIPIISGSILKVINCGAYFDMVARGVSMVASIFSRMCRRAGLAWLMASAITLMGSPVIFMSICRAVMPLSVPATLKSMSPRKSSMPWMSVRMRTSSPSLIRPMAAPLTGLVIGTPASISERVEPQTEPMEVEPLEDSTSDTTRIT